MFFSIFKNLRPINHPNTNVPKTDTMVKNIPLLPEAIDSWMFIPKPRPTTEYCSNVFDIFLLNAANGFPQNRANIKPVNSANGGVSHVPQCEIAGIALNMMETKKMTSIPM